jgi:hypothetical protein
VYTKQRRLKTIGKKRKAKNKVNVTVHTAGTSSAASLSTINICSSIENYFNKNLFTISQERERT